MPQSIEVIDSKEKYPELRDAINTHGEVRDGIRKERGQDHENLSRKEVVINSWARGPLLYIRELNGDGETDERGPCLANGLLKRVVGAGFIPWGFRPNRNYTGDEIDRKNRSTHMWYLVPREDLDDMCEETCYLQRDDGTFVTKGDTTLPKPFSKEVAEEIASEVETLSVVETHN